MANIHVWPVIYRKSNPNHGFTQSVGQALYIDLVKKKKEVLPLLAFRPLDTAYKNTSSDKTFS